MSEDEKEIEWNISLTVDGNEVLLRSVADVRKFCNEYRDFYQFVREEKDKLSQNPAAQVRNWANDLTRLDGQITQAKSNANVLSQLKGQIAGAGVSGLPVHRSSDAHAIERIWKNHGAEAGVGAALMATSSSLSQVFGSRKLTLGALEFLADDLGITPGKSADIRSALSETRANIETAHAQFSGDAEKLLDEHADQIGTQESEFERVRDWSLSAMQKAGDDQEKRIQAAIEKIETTDKTFTEHMQLRAPREYWANKAKGHETLRWWLAGASAAWFGFAGAGTAYVGWELFQYALDFATGDAAESGAPLTVLASLGGLGLIVTTVFFWIARILVRLFLSEIHLGMDARERVVMVESYLALLHEGAVDSEQRSIVLSALFRPTQDGIVKDDAAADPTLLGLMRQFAK